MLFHTLDIASNQANLINSYKTKRPRVLLLWSFISLPLFGFVYEFTFPDNSETMDTDGIDRNDFLKINKVLSLGAMLFTFSLLYFLILRRAFRVALMTESNVSSPLSSPRKQHWLFCGVFWQRSVNDVIMFSQNSLLTSSSYISSNFDSDVSDYLISCLISKHFLTIDKW